MKKGMILMLLSGLFSFGFASNKVAIDFFEAGEHALAKSLFLSGTKDALDNYYLGQIYLLANKKDSAQFYFNRGLQSDAMSAYNKIGLAAINLFTDPKGATKELNNLAKPYKKDADMLVNIAKAFEFANMTDKANEYIAKAKKADKKSALPYIFEGDRLMKQKNTNDAASKYENAIYFDPNSKVAQLKLAQLYENVRTQVAVDYLKKAIAADPNYAIGLMTLGDLSFRKGFYPQALDAYNSYFKLQKPTAKQFENYVASYYFTKRYKEAINALASINYTTPVMNRLKMYSLYELQDFPGAMSVAENYMSTTPASEKIAQDYTTYADLLYKEKRFKEAADNYLAAYNLDPEKNKGLIKDIAKSYENAKDYAKAFEYYNQIVNNENASNEDIFNLGRSYYIAGTDETITDAITKTGYLQQADKAFENLVNKLPEAYMGYFWRARANSALDPKTEAGLAKPYYEKALELMLPQKDERKNEIIEAYRYLGYYYYLKNDKYQSLAYWNRVLEFNPNDATALQVIKGLSAPAAKPKR